ncbi:MAG: site-specific integrase [Planctomycetes bacterium]|nr:site-specific integrase [Planctomycetota bacterium]
METAKQPSRRRSRGNAWHWRQTNSWYFTPPGTKRRVRLHDEDGHPIRGKGNRQVAELALARIKAAGNWRPEAQDNGEDSWLVAKICSLFVEHCEQRTASGTCSSEYRDEVVRYLNDFCSYCGALAVGELRKGHVQHWVESHPTWRSSATQRNAITTVISAFNHAQEMHGVATPLRGLKKPPQRPRLQSFDADEEQSLYDATDEPFANFLFAALHTGLRPFCELARLTSEDVVETDRGMMWRVYSSKTKKTRKIPVRGDVAQQVRRRLDDVPWRSAITLFPNAQGRPWKKVTGVARFLKIKRELGWDTDPVRKNYSSYTCRHTFAHRMLAGFWNDGAGCSIEVLAELIGDTPKVTFDHYGKEWGQHYQEPLWLAIGVPENDVASTACDDGSTTQIST